MQTAATGLVVVNSGIDLNAVFADIKGIERQIKLVRANPNVPLEIVQQGLKSCSIKLGGNYAKLARHYYSLVDGYSDGNRYRQLALRQLTSYCDQTCNVEADYSNWYELSGVYAILVRLHLGKGDVLCDEETVQYLVEGLRAVNRAISVKNTHEARFRKFFLLQLWVESGRQPPESPIDSLQLYLKEHTQPDSEEYLKYAQLYGSELIAQERLEEAVEWLTGLLGRGNGDVQTYFILGLAEGGRNGEQALTYFELALSINPDNRETQLWAKTQHVRNVIEALRNSKKMPAEQQITDIVGMFNELCSFFAQCNEHLGEETEVFRRFQESAADFFVRLIPEMANILVHLQQFGFALYLHKIVLDSFDQFRQFGVLDEQAKISLLIVVGTLSALRKDLVEAEICLGQALELDPVNAIAYQNLILVYSDAKDEAKLLSLIERLQPQRNDPTFSGVFFNLGTAFVLLNRMEQAKENYRFSLEQDKDNWDTRLHLARVLSLEDDGLIQAEELLAPYLDAEMDDPFWQSSDKQFKLYFCLASLSALNGNQERAQECLKLAGKTHAEIEQTHSLQSYLYLLKQQKSDPSLRDKIRDEFRVSIRKMEFQCRAGKYLPGGIEFHADQLIGYHGTSDIYLSGLGEGVKPKKGEGRQYRGDGFYIGEKIWIARFFAKKKADEDGGKPIVIEVYARVNLIGGEPGKKIGNAQARQFDFIHSSVDHLEAYRQFYVFENSLHKLRVDTSTPTEVNWGSEDEEHVQKFVRRCLF